MGARTVLSLAGNYFIGPIGGAIGGLIGGAIDGPGKAPTQYNVPPQQDLRVLGTEYGQIIPYIRGAKRTAGQIWWNNDFTYDETTTTETTGGKGGGEPEQTTVTVTRVYKISMLIGFSRNVGVGIAKIWNNGDLIYNASVDAVASTVNASAGQEFCTRMTFYSGADGQEPDPIYALAVGDENAPAYIGRSTVFLHEFRTGERAIVPNLTFEFVADGVSAYTQDPFTSMTMSSTNYWKAAQADGTIVAGALVSGTNIAVSDDGGDTWEYFAPFDASDLVWGLMVGYVEGEPRFVAFTNTGTSTHKTWTSDTGGRTWVQRDTIALGAYPSAGDWGSPEPWVDGVFVVVLGNSNQCLTSESGFGWIARTMPVTAQWQAVKYLDAHERFVATANTNIGNQIAISDNGTTWTGKVTPSGDGLFTPYAHSIAYDGEDTILINGPNTGSQDILVSYDAGDTWGSYSLPNYPTDSWENLGPAICISGLWVFSGAGGKILTTRDLSQTWTIWSAGLSAGHKWILYDEVNSRVIVRTTTADYLYESQISIMLLLTKSTVPISELQSDLMLLAGYTAGQLDVTELASITNEVDSFAWSEASGIREPSEMLMRNYHYEAVMSGEKILFRPRAGASVATIPYAELGTTLGADDPEPFALNLGNDIEISARKGLRYVNLSFDYQPDFAEGDRLISTMESSIDMDSTPIGLTPSRAKAIADARTLDAYVARVTSSIALQSKWAELEPTDVITVTASDGSTFRMRVVSVSDDFPKYTFELVMDDATVFSQEGIASADYDAPTTLAEKPDTEMVLFDPPLLSDAENSPSIYVATRGATTPYPGAAVFKSTDAFTTYNLVATVDESAVLGTTTTALSRWTGPRVFDERSTVRVDVGDAGVITSTTRAAMLADPTLNAFLIGNEVVRVRDADLVTAGVYDLSGFLRGRLGTEWAMTGHTSGENIVQLRAAGIRRMLLENNQLGVLQSYRGVTRGRAISTEATQTVTPMGVNLKPRAPKRVKVRRNVSGDITFEVMRRTRFTTRRGSALGSSVPLGENEERYELDLFTVGSPQGAAVTLTIEFTNSLTYTAAEQVADFGQVMTYGTLVVQAYQISNAIGRGYRLETTA